VLVEDLERGPGTQGGTAREAPELGDAGSLLVTEEDRQQPACDGEAGAPGPGTGGEVGLRVGAYQNTEALGVLEGVKAGPQLADPLAEVGELLPVEASIEVAQGAVGLAVEALAREPALEGLPGDVAVPAEEDGAGTGEPLERRYDTRG
jgi:hypothetical protein